MKMVTWYVGVRTQFSKNPGAFGKYLQEYLEPELWDLLKQTYSGASYERTWEALFVMGQLFRRTALVVAVHFGYEYPEGEDAKVTAHIHHVRCLSSDAKEIY
jgi:aminoglycoside 6-adenylyltransferase